MDHQQPAALTARKAELLLSEAESVAPCLQMGLQDAKGLREKLLARGIPTAFGRDDHCTKGCSPKVIVLARPQDFPAISALLRAEWMGSVAAVGSSDEQALQTFNQAFVSGVPSSAPSEEPPCPACGYVGALKADGSCADCGLVLG